ncbi:MAG: ABC-type transport auxiliary lipoprotein family protein [Gammaproteobacteria bacterium]
MSMARAAALLVSFTLLCACATVPPPPRDQFHRLVPATLAAPADVNGGDGRLVFVPPFSASGLHGQRALLHAEADGTTLEQYGYHFWIDSPRLLLQQDLATYLGRSLGARVVTQSGARDGLVVRGHVFRFERIGGAADGDTAVVALGFDVFEAGTVVPELSRRLEREIPIGEGDVAAYVAATSVATREIFAEVARDLAPLVAR